METTESIRAFLIPGEWVSSIDLSVVLGIGLKNQKRLIGNSKRSIIDYNRFSACFVRKTEYSFFTKNNKVGF